MKRYSSYKDSDVEWIGEIPSHWLTKKLKHISLVLPSNVDKHIYEDEIPVRLCNYTDVYYNEFINRKTKLKKGSCNENEYQKFKLTKGDVIITKDSESPDDIGIPTLVTDELDDVICGYHLTMIKPISVLGGYIFRFIQSDRTSSYFEVNSSGITRYGLGKAAIENLFLAIPPMEEQKRIIDYLENKTQKIDNLIQQKERKIELLKEKRTALINQVVTKGLNPNVGTKDSEVDWIGEIPTHWTHTKMKYGIELVNEKGQPEPNDVKVSPENVESDTGVCLNYYSDYEGDGMKFKKGDVLLNKLRLYLKKILFCEREGYSLGEMIVLRAKENIFNKYFYYLIFNQGLIDLLDSQSTGIKMPRVSPETILNSTIPFPPMNEQFEIVNYLDDQTKEIAELIQLEERKIELIKEYRQSMISEVVTGKIRVCEEDHSLTKQTA